MFYYFRHTFSAPSPPPLKVAMYDLTILIITVLIVRFAYNNECAE